MVIIYWQHAGWVYCTYLQAQVNAKNLFMYLYASQLC